MKLAVLEAIGSARAEKRPVARAVRLDGAEERVLFPEGAKGDGPLEDAAWRALRLDRAEAVEVDGRRWLIQPFNPPLRLLLVGAVHIAQPLARMARLTGYAVTVVDPRAAFAQAARFSEVEVWTGWPDEALEALAPDRRTAVVTLTHDPKLDDPALDAALSSPAFYIGCLGSRKTHEARLGRLEQRGFGADELARVHGPVGLSIGARSPAEIAVSILAEITQALRRVPA